MEHGMKQFGGAQKNFLLVECHFIIIKIATECARTCTCYERSELAAQPKHTQISLFQALRQPKPPIIHNLPLNMFSRWIWLVWICSVSGYVQLVDMFSWWICSVWICSVVDTFSLDMFSRGYVQQQDTFSRWIRLVVDTFRLDTFGRGYVQF